jgi:hypothetical protein
MLLERPGEEEQPGHCHQQSGRDDPHLANAAVRGGKALPERHAKFRGNGMSIRQ